MHVLASPHIHKLTAWLERLAEDKEDDATNNLLQTTLQTFEKEGMDYTKERIERIELCKVKDTRPRERGWNKMTTRTYKTT